MEKENYYTTNTITDSTNNYKSEYTTNYNYTFSCQYLLPCGICSRTNNPCPKHSGWYESPISWNEWTCNTSKFDTTGSNSYTTNVDGDLKSDYTTHKKELEDFFNDK